MYSHLSFQRDDDTLSSHGSATRRHVDPSTGVKHPTVAEDTELGLLEAMDVFEGESIVLYVPDEFACSINFDLLGDTLNDRRVLQLVDVAQHVHIIDNMT